MVRGSKHDSKDAISTIRKTKKYHPSGFSLDKAFGKEEIHRFINEELRAISIIPPKKGIKNGKYRLSMLSLFSKPKYNRRSIVETVFSVLKRVFGDKNRNRSDRLRNKETKLRNTCYNIYRFNKSLNIKIQI